MEMLCICYSLVTQNYNYSMCRSLGVCNFLFFFSVWVVEPSSKAAAFWKQLTFLCCFFTVVSCSIGRDWG